MMEGIFGRREEGYFQTIEGAPPGAYALPMRMTGYSDLAFVIASGSGGL